MSVKLMSKVWDMDIPINTKMVCLALCDQANDQGECYPSISTICKRCSLEERAVRRNIHALEEISVLWREYRTGHSTIYHLTPDKYQPTATPPHGGPLPMVDPPLQGTPPHGGPHPLPMADPPPPPMADPHNHQLTIKNQKPISIVHADDDHHKPAEPAPERKPRIVRAITDWPGFDDFWAAYPDKKAKKDAKTAWNKLRPSPAITSAILADLPLRRAQDRRWLDGFIPNPATYLNGERWQDSITPAMTATPAGNHYGTRRESSAERYDRLMQATFGHLHEEPRVERAVSGEVV